MESTAGGDPPRTGRTVIQLGPAGVPLTRLPLITYTHPAVTTTACGYTPTAELAVSPVRTLTRVTLLRFGFATHAMESLSSATPVAPELLGRLRVVTTGGAPFEKSNTARVAAPPPGATSSSPWTATLRGADPVGGTLTGETE